VFWFGHADLASFFKVLCCLKCIHWLRYQSL